MRPLSSTEGAPIVFRPKDDDFAQYIKAPTGKIGWVRAVSNRAGARFNLVIKDALGREKFRKDGCTSETREFGELINIPTQIGEDLEIEVEDMTGAEELIVHIN
jgi:hypothetical protein